MPQQLVELLLTQMLSVLHQSIIFPVGRQCGLEAGELEGLDQIINSSMLQRFADTAIVAGCGNYDDVHHAPLLTQGG
ncbi:hypothetical protein D3C81_1659760 [compost metagenome]